MSLPYGRISKSIFATTTLVEKPRGGIPAGTEEARAAIARVRDDPKERWRSKSFMRPATPKPKRDAVLPEGCDDERS